jgi:hypothetical protein
MEIKPGIYRHYKGNEFEVICVGLHEDTKERLVVYKALSRIGEFEEGTIWIRPLASFVEQVEVDGKMAPRFRKIG